MKDRLEAALGYLARGWFVIPLDPAMKFISVDVARRLAWVEHSPVCTEAEIERWFSIEPEINIGIDLARSGLTVVDVDYPDRWNIWLSAQDDLPPAPRVKTGKGYHLYFSASPEDVCGTLWDDHGFAIGDFLTPQMVPWRNDHAYAVAPPSRLAYPHSGEYVWLETPQIAPLHPVPDWLRAMVRMPSEPGSWFDDGPDDWVEQDIPGYYDIDEYEPDPEDPEHEAFIDEWFGDHFPPGSDGPYDGWEADADCAYDEHQAEMAQAEAEDLGLFDMPDMPEPDEDQG